MTEFVFHGLVERPWLMLVACVAESSKIALLPLEEYSPKRVVRGCVEFVRPYCGPIDPSLRPLAEALGLFRVVEAMMIWPSIRKLVSRY